MSKTFIFVLTLMACHNAFAAKWTCTSNNRDRLEAHRVKIYNYIEESEAVFETMEWVDVRTPLHSLSKKSRIALGENYAKDGLEGLDRLNKKIAELASLKRAANLATSHLRNAIKHANNNVDYWDQFKIDCDRIGVSQRMSKGAERTQEDLDVYKLKQKQVRQVSRDLYQDLNIFRAYADMINERNARDFAE